MKRYLETITAGEFRERMSAAGLKANTIRKTPKNVPDWLKEDAGIWPDEFGDFITRRQVMSRLTEDGLKKGTPVPLIGRVRLAVFPDDTVYWCKADMLIHSNLVAYAMCAGKLPIENERFGDGHWAWNVEGYTDILLLEHMSLDNGGWYLAESYDSDVADRIIVKIANDVRYDSVFAKIGLKDKTKIGNLNR